MKNIQINMKRLLTLLLLTNFIASNNIRSKLIIEVEPEPRGLHTSVIYQDLLVIYGGVKAGPKTDPYTATPLNDMLIFDLSSKKWYKPQLANFPPATKFHSTAMVGSKMYVYVGGFDEKSPLRSFDFETLEWTPITKPIGDSSIIGSTMVLADNRLMVYGGVSFESGKPNPSKVTDFVFSYQTNSDQWVMNPNAEPAYFHSTCMVPNVQGVSFGGANKDGAMDKTTAFSATNPPTMNINSQPKSPPAARIGASMSCIDGSGYLMGGATIDWNLLPRSLNVLYANNSQPNSFIWTSATDKGQIPANLMGHSAAVNDTDIYVYGGLRNEDTNVYKYNVKSSEWVRIEPFKKPSENPDTNTKISTDDSAGSPKPKDSSIDQTTIIAIVGAIFGILMMAVIIAVGLRHWRQKNKHAHTSSRSITTGENHKGPDSAVLSWPEFSGMASGRFSAYSAANSITPSSDGHLSPPRLQNHYSSDRSNQFNSNSHLLPPSSIAVSMQRSNSNEVDTDRWATGERAIGHNDEDEYLDPTTSAIRYQLQQTPRTSPKLSPGAQSHFTGSKPGSSVGVSSQPYNYNQTRSPVSTNTYAENNPYFPSLSSENVSPLDRLASLHTSLAATVSSPHDGLSTPTSSIQNWPFTDSDVGTIYPTTLSRDYSLDQRSNQPVLTRNPSVRSNSLVVPRSLSNLSGLHVDAALLKRLSTKYRITAASVAKSLGDVDLIQATEIPSLEPVTIKVYLHQAQWHNDCQLLQILDGRFVPKLKEFFDYQANHKTSYALIHQRCGISLTNLLASQSKPLADSEIRHLIKGVANLLHFFHSRGIVVTDLQPSDLFLTSNPSSDPLILGRVTSCLMQGDRFNLEFPPRYCAPELAPAFIESDSWFSVSPSMDMWALGCFTYELYLRAPLMGPQISEVEALHFLSDPEPSTLPNGLGWGSDGRLVLPNLSSIPAEVAEVLNGLLVRNSDSRLTANQLLSSDFIRNCPNVSASLPGLSPQLPPRCRNGELDPELGLPLLNLRQQLVATSEIQVPRLVLVLPDPKLQVNWKDARYWDSLTFRVHLLCEGDFGMHLVNGLGLPLHNPHQFLAEAGLLVAVTAQLCASYAGPDLLKWADPQLTSQLLKAKDNDLVGYFEELATVFERYCTTLIDPDFEQTRLSAQKLVAARGSHNISYLKPWIPAARTFLTQSRHLALNSVRSLLNNLDSEDLGLLYSRTQGNWSANLNLPSELGLPNAVQPSWHAWLCSHHIKHRS